MASMASAVMEVTWYGERCNRGDMASMASVVIGLTWRAL